MGERSYRNQILQTALKRYGTEPEYPWGKYPGHAVLRHLDNKKWYALLMNIPMEKLGLPGGAVDVMNIKLEPLLIGSLRMQKGFLPAYHMNKENWLTVLLDGTVVFEKIVKLLDMSFELTGGRTKSPKSSVRNTDWIIPANPKYYDVEKAVRKGKNETFTWKQSNNICVGDMVYLYVGAPVAAIRYKCRAVEVNIPYEYSDKKLSMSRVMRLELLEEYDQTLCGIGVMREYGVGPVRGPRSMPGGLKEELERKSLAGSLANTTDVVQGKDGTK